MNESTLPPVVLDVAKHYVATTLGLLSVKHGKRVDIADCTEELIGPAVVRMHIGTTAGDNFYVDLDISRMIELALTDCGRLQ